MLFETLNQRSDLALNQLTALDPLSHSARLIVSAEVRSVEM